MRLFFVLCFLTVFTGSIFAQKTQFTSADESDPQAKAILEKLKSKYQAYSSIEAKFTLEIEIPEQPIEKQTGLIRQKGDQYYLELGNQVIISDGEAIYLVLKNNKEVQINDMPDEDEDDSLLSPSSMFNFYEKGEFVYFLTNEMMEKGKAIQQIEFKPLDDYAEYSKLRMTVERDAKKIVRIKAFSKDGSRYTFKLNQLSPNKSFGSAQFRFDAAKFPGYHVEDLRE